MSAIFGVKGKKTNHKKGIAAARKQQKRTDALTRQAAYAKLSLEEKKASAGKKEITKLTKSPAVI